MATAPFVLFVCLHGSAKSVIGGEYFRRLARERGLDATTSSAGTEPDAEIPPRVAQGLAGDGFDVRGVRPRAVTRADLERASRVIAFGCELGPPRHPSSASSAGTTCPRSARTTGARATSSPRACGRSSSTSLPSPRRANGVSLSRRWT